MIRLTCTSTVFLAVYVDWAANVRLFRHVESLAHGGIAGGRISKAAFICQIVWCGIVTLYPMTCAPFAMGWKTKLSLQLFVGQLTFSSIMHMILARLLPSPGAEWRNRIICENLVIVVIMGLFFFVIWLGFTPQEFHPHRNQFFWGILAAYLLCFGVQWVVVQGFGSSRGWVHTPVSVPLRRLEFFSDGIFVITTMLVLVELSSMVSQELLTLPMVSIPGCDLWQPGHPNASSCLECNVHTDADGSYDYEPCPLQHTGGRWYPSAPLTEFCEDIPVIYHEEEHDKAHEAGHHTASQRQYASTSASYIAKPRRLMKVSGDPPSPAAHGHDPNGTIHGGGRGALGCDQVSCGSRENPVPWCACSPTQLAEGRDPCVPVDFSLSKNGTFYTAVLDWYWKENVDKARTHLATILLLFTMWFLHHIVFLAPHESHADAHGHGEDDGGHDRSDAGAEGAGGHGGGGGAEGEGVGGEAYGFSVGNSSVDDELVALQSSFRRTVSAEATKTMREQERSGQEAGWRVLALNMVALLCVGLIPYCIDCTVRWKNLSHASTFPIFCAGFIEIVYCSCLLGVLWQMRPSAEQWEVGKGWLQMGALAGLSLMLGAILSGCVSPQAQLNLVHGFIVDDTFPHHTHTHHARARARALCLSAFPSVCLLSVWAVVCGVGPVGRYPCTSFCSSRRCRWSCTAQSCRLGRLCWRRAKRPNAQVALFCDNRARRRARRRRRVLVEV